MPHNQHRKRRAGRPQFTCPLCQGVTYHPRDVAAAYCPCCGGPFLPRDCEHRRERHVPTRD